jgi:hypothetical protein
MSFFKNVNVKQDIVADNNNSSNINIGVNAFFTGASTSTLGVAGIQVSLKTDQNCTVYVDQSPDGNNWDIIDIYDYFYSIGNFGITVQAINSYVRVRVKNIGNKTTTYFRLQTALCPIVEAVPRTLDENGDFITAIHSIKDEYGWSVENTPMGEMRMVEPYRLVGATFHGNTIDTNFWTTTVISGASVSQVAGRIELRTNPQTTGANAFLQSVRAARYVGGNANRFRCTSNVGNSGVENNVKRWGCFNSSDGAFYQLSGNIFGVGTLKTGVYTIINNSGFNGNLGSEYYLDTNAKTYEIYYTNSKIYYSLNDNLLHTSSFPLDTWTSTVNLPIRFENVNLGTTTGDTSIYTRVATISRLGPYNSSPIYKNISTAGSYTGKYAAGTLQALVINNLTAGTITLYDGTTTSAPKIATISVDAKAVSPIFLPYNCPFFSGLTVVTSANTDCTIIYE